ncbi:MAG TPA: hypothetical protein VLS89_14815 [Candidatus Nanopelagicales bacterium]|nr:hypothetical protein [Candidatus Nanopelagicales bacterium]
MKRSEIDRWMSKRATGSPRPKGFIIRRGEMDVEAFQVSEYAEVSHFCKPGDLILVIMPDDSVGLTYRVEDDGAGDGAHHAGPTESVIKVFGEQIGKVYEGITGGYETLIASLRSDLARKDTEADRLMARLERLEGKAIDLVRIEHEQKIEETKVRHSQAMTDEYLGRAFTVLDQVVDGFLQHHSRKQKIKGIFDKLKPETLRAIMGDLSEDDVNDLMTLADDLEKDEKFSSASKEPKKLPN